MVRELREVLTKLQEAGYRASKKNRTVQKRANLVGVLDKPKRGKAN